MHLHLHIEHITKTPKEWNSGEKYKTKGYFKGDYSGIHSFKNCTILSAKKE